MIMHEYLKNDQETIPTWLLEIKEGDKFPRDDFFKSRIVFYPGSHTDGHAVKVFGSTHSAHSFIYVDYGVTQEVLETELINHGFLGYENLIRIQLSERDLAPYGWVPSVYFKPNYPINYAADLKEKAYSFLQILERKPEYDEAHGPKRLAILFLFADGIATYDALFCQSRNKSTPFAILLQDHGFGGNYDKFGRGGLMEKIASHAKIKPTYLLVGENTEPWLEYSKLENIIADHGGMHNSARFLYKIL